MYIWKLWRDSRSRLLTCIALGTAWSVGAAYFITRNVSDPQAAWDALTAQVIPCVVAVGVLAALMLTEIGLGRDLSTGSVEFLLTRPRRRRYFAWTGWLFGVGQVFVVMMLIVTCGFALTTYMTGTVANWRCLAIPILMAPAMMLLFGVGYLISICTNGRNGGIATFGIVIVYSGAIPFLYKYWHIQTPQWWFTALPGWIQNEKLPFPLVAALGWALFALLFPFLAQLSFEKKQI